MALVSEAAYMTVSACGGGFKPPADVVRDGPAGTAAARSRYTARMTSAEHSLLGKSVAYRDEYDASLLFPIPRAGKRAELGLHGALPFHGVDIWNAYELSWLDLRGKPVVALAEFRVPAASPHIIESKSFKLYLNG